MELASTLVFTAIALLVAYLLSGMKRPPSFPPGPPRWPIFGTLLMQIRSKSFFHQMSIWAEKYGKIYSVKSGQLNLVMVSDLNVAKEALAMEEFSDRHQWEFYMFYMKNQNAGVIMSNGEFWKVNRRFALRHLRDFGFGRSSMEHLIMDEMKNLAETLYPASNESNGVANGSTQNKMVVAQLDEGLNAAVTNVIWWLMASKRVSRDDPEFLTILKTIEGIMNLDFPKLVSYFPTLFKILPGQITGTKRLEKRREHFTSYMLDVIDEHRASLDASEPRDLVDCYLVEQQRLRQEGLDDSFFTDHRIAWTLCDLFLAGAETTSTTLRWFTLYMITFPEVQKKIQDEIDTVVGRDRLPCWEDRHSLTYTEAAIWELWRHTSFVPIGVDRVANADVRLGKYFIPKGTLLVTLLKDIHYDPDNFENPKEFRPERFLEKDGSLVKNAKIMPFQAGKRQCLGENLARMNTFLAVAYLLQKFSFQKVPGEKYTLDRQPASSEVVFTPQPFKLGVILRS